MKRTPASHPALAAGAWLCAAALGLAVASAAASEPGPGIEVGFVNGVYEDLDAGIQPIRQGAVTVHLSSPEHRLTVHGNRLTLVPNADGTVSATLAVDFEGAGHLIADVDGIGRFEDDVAASRQTARAAGTVRIERKESGYLVTVVDADPNVRLEITSGIARRLGGACRAVAMLPFVVLPCGGLEAALSSVDVPMPGPGAQFLVPADRLGAEETAYFDRFTP